MFEKKVVPQVHLVFVEGAGHPVPQRAELPPHLGAFLHLLCSVLLVFVSAQASKEAETHLRRLSHKRNLPLYEHLKGLLKVRYYINFKIVLFMPS